MDAEFTQPRNPCSDYTTLDCTINLLSPCIILSARQFYSQLASSVGLSLAGPIVVGNIQAKMKYHKSGNLQQY